MSIRSVSSIEVQFKKNKVIKNSVMSSSYFININNILKKRVRVKLIIISATFQVIGLAFLSAWTSPSIPILTERGYSEAQTNNVVTYYIVGVLVAPTISCFLLSKAGRKTSIIFASTLNVIATFLQFSTSTPGLLYVGRLTGGISNGCLGVILPIYLAECCHPRDRELSSGFLSIFMSLGLFIEYVVAPFMSYSLNNIIIACLCFIALASFLLLAEESPVVLLKRNEEALAKNVLELFWSQYESEDSDKIIDEIDKIKICLLETKAYTTWEIIKSIFTTKSNLKSSLLVLLLMIGCNLTGVATLIMYLQPILIDAGTPYSSAVCSAISGVMMVLASFLLPWFVDKLGAKRTLIFATTGYLLSLTCLGLYFCLKYNMYNVSKIYWLPVASSAGFSSFSSLGLIVLPYMLRGELLSPRIQSIMAPASDLLANLSAFLSTLLFMQLRHRCFITLWTYSAILFVEEILIIIFLPDTSNLSKSEIHAALVAK